MGRPRRSTLGLGLVVLVAVVLAACGSGGAGESEAAPTTAAPTTTTTAPVDHRSAMVARLTIEWGDATVAERIGDGER